MYISFPMMDNSHDQECSVFTAMTFPTGTGMETPPVDEVDACTHGGGLS